MWKRARRDIEDIYRYIAMESMEPENGRMVVEKIAETILSLDVMPERYHMITEGKYANKGYRRVTVKNFVILYTVSTTRKQVGIVTIQYAGRDL